MPCVGHHACKHPPGKTTSAPFNDAEQFVSRGMRLFLLLLASAAHAGRVEVHPPSDCPATSGRGVLCSLADAAEWVSTQNLANNVIIGGIEVCLHPGTHVLRQPLRLNESHSGTRWTTCASAAPSARATISGGLRIPSASWQREAGGLWSATLPVGTKVAHLRTLWVGGVRANRTVLNATALLGDLRPISTGYVSQREVLKS